ncbi:MAG TPA: hypothetical protein VF331_26485 [Polyangiales bacterium]
MTKQRRLPKRKRRTPSRRERGVALVMVLTVIAVITVMVSEMSQNTSTEFQVSVNQRDRVRAEFLARSGTNLMRLLLAQEPLITRAVSPFVSMILGHSIPQINVWRFADTILAPFANYGSAKRASTSIGIDFNQMRGLADTGGSFEITAFPENSKLNVNNPVYTDDPAGSLRLAKQLYSMMGGFQTQGPNDALFNKLDADGQQTTRLDIVSDIIDWWDPDEQRTVFDPGRLEVTAAGGEDDIYARFTDPYRVKNSPFDSLEELRMVRGIGDDFWATFIDPNPDDPRARRVTVYGSGSVNPNEAPPDVLLARVCSVQALQMQPLCQDPVQAMGFLQLLGTVRALAPIPWFGTATEFTDFLQGKGQLYTLLATVLTAQNPLLQWKVVIPQPIPPDLNNAFIFKASIFTIQTIGRVGHTSVRLNMIVNTDPNWLPPPMTTARAAPMGIIIHYRVD